MTFILGVNQIVLTTFDRRMALSVNVFYIKYRESLRPHTCLFLFLEELINIKLS